MRRLWFALGAALVAYGLWRLLFGDTNGTRPLATLAWAAGALVAHDGFVAPLVFTAGWLVRALHRRTPLARTRVGRRLAGTGWLVAAPLVPLGVVALLSVPRHESPARQQNTSIWPPLSIVDVMLAALVGLAVLVLAHVVAGLARPGARTGGVVDTGGAAGSGAAAPGGTAGGGTGGGPA